MTEPVQNNDPSESHDGDRSDDVLPRVEASPVVNFTLQSSSTDRDASPDSDTSAFADLTQPRGTSEQPSGIDILTREIALSEVGLVKTSFQVARIGADSRVVISVPAGSNNRFRNAKAGLDLAHLLLRETPVAHVRLRVRIDDREMHEQGLLAERHGRSAAAEQYPEFEEFFALAVRQQSERYSVEALVQPQNNSLLEVKLAMREAQVLDGATHLFLPTHCSTLMRRLVLAARSEAGQMRMDSWTESLGIVQNSFAPSYLAAGGSPIGVSIDENGVATGQMNSSKGLQVVIWDHGEGWNVPTGVFESLSLALAEFGERRYPEHMDRLALKKGKLGPLYDLIQRVKVYQLRRRKGQ